jgi:transposase-like protein
LTIEQVAERFGVAPQTIYNWRSNGLPEKRERQFLDMIQTKKNPLLGRVILEPTPMQSRTWQRAALANKQILEDWALESLDTMALVHEARAMQERSAMVAEEPNGTYGAGKPSAASPEKSAAPPAPGTNAPDK